MPAVQMPAPVIKEGADDEPLRCSCGHTFERSQLDMLVEVEDFKWSGSLEELEEAAWEVLREHVTLRSECAHCSDCTVEQGSVYHDSSAEPEEEWMCTVCLSKYEDEQEAVDCCG